MVYGGRVPVGVVHGRFQVLHNDHMKYILAAKERCDYLVVGITNPYPSMTKENSKDSHRHLASANPLNFFDRSVMIREALLEAGLELSEFSIVPFPINIPERITNYVPQDAKYYLTVYDEWGLEKMSILKSCGLDTEVLWERPESEKQIIGSYVRQLIREEGDWKSLVPASVAKMIEEQGLGEKIIGSI